MKTSATPSSAPIWRQSSTSIFATENRQRCIRNHHARLSLWRQLIPHPPTTIKTPIRHLHTTPRRDRPHSFPCRQSCGIESTRSTLQLTSSEPSMLPTAGTSFSVRRRSFKSADRFKQRLEFRVPRHHERPFTARRQRDSQSNSHAKSIRPRSPVPGVLQVIRSTPAHSDPTRAVLDSHVGLVTHQ